MKYLNDVRSVTDDKAIKMALRAYVEAIRRVTVTRTGEDERAVRKAEDELHTLVYEYALAVPVTLDISVSHTTYEACGTNQRKLMVWEIGVEGDKFNPHRWNDACRVAGCVPLTRDEFIAHFRLTKQVIDRVQVLLSFENMEKAPKL